MSLQFSLIVPLYYNDGGWGYTEFPGAYTGRMPVPVPVKLGRDYVHKAVAAATMLGYNDVKPKYPGAPRCYAVAHSSTGDLLGIFDNIYEARAFVVALPGVPSETC